MTQTSVPRSSGSGAGGTPPRLAPGHPDSHGRFAPGEHVAGRYRIVGLIGRGGMGEVYRADDMMLGQPVALKFLPQSLEQDPGRLSRLLNEVRTARQVSHPCVCRVHDIGEVDGQHFISMEYVDGENLDSLMRRIGRPAAERAVRIARQLCAGIGAAHDRGILHRDLKPANVLIDGRGQVKITDFGLAGLLQEFEGAEIRAGTPDYMSPEQLSGEEVTVRSEIYSLGLVLYELFTGKPAFRAESRAEATQLHRESLPTDPSNLVEGLDPAVERIVLRCLEKSPERRPASTMAVAVALPGGDPLAAALAAGETPSPELVAEAGKRGGVSPRVGWAALLVLVAGMGLVAWLSGRTQLSQLAGLEKSPELLSERARDVLTGLGYTERGADSLFGFQVARDYLAHLDAEDRAPDRWRRLRNERPGAVRFWYRESPQPLVRTDRMNAPHYLDPPPLLSGTVGVVLDGRGRLRRLDAVPPEHAPPAAPPGAPDWDAVFRAAGLDLAAFEPAEPAWFPVVFGDTQAAWTGSYPDPPRTRIRVEAVAFRGRPVAFRIVEPWTSPTRMIEAGHDGGYPLPQIVFLGWILIVMGGAAFVARRNLRLGRGDRRGALRLALFFLVSRMLAWLFGAHHVPSLVEIDTFMGALARAMFMGGLAWVIYIAIEPYLRRLWPEMLVSWVRLLDGRFRDPLVGRDLLLGGLMGLVMVLGAQLYPLLMGWIGLAPPRPDLLGWPGSELSALRGLRHTVATFLDMGTLSTILALVSVVGLLLLRLVLRRQTLAIAATFVAMVIVSYAGTGNTLGDLAISVVGAALTLGVLFRFGLLPVVVGFVVSNALIGMPLTADVSSWIFPLSLFSLAAMLAVAVYGFARAVGPRAAFMLRDD